MKKVSLVLALFAAFSFGAAAQEFSPEPYIQIQGGASYDFGNADFSKVTNFSYMFYTGASALEYVDLGGTATTAATTMVSMFNNNQYLKHLDLGPNFTLAATHTNMFLDTARQTSIASAGDNEKKCQLYASQAFYNDVRANESTFNAARFNFHVQ